MPNEYGISNLTKEVTIYIAGFVVYKLTSVLRCEICIKSLYANDKGMFLNSLTTMKNRGGKKVVLCTLAMMCLKFVSRLQRF